MVLKSILPHRRPRIANAPGVRFDRPGGTCLQLKCCHCAPVAQMDRAFASGAKGRWFESTRAYQTRLKSTIWGNRENFDQFAGLAKNRSVHSSAPTRFQSS